MCDSVFYFQLVNIYTHLTPTKQTNQHKYVNICPVIYIPIWNKLNFSDQQILTAIPSETFPFPYSDSTIILRMSTILHYLYDMSKRWGAPDSCNHLPMYLAYTEVEIVHTQ